MEALLRWDHPERGLIPPAVLIPLAEQSGDIIDIGRWVLEHACFTRHRREDAAGGEPFVMGVNVSAHQLMAPGSVSMVERVISASDTPAEHLCLEVTESAFVQDAQLALSVLSQLKQLGIPVAPDDFGTGYSSLSYLRQFRFDIIKIDQSFVADLRRRRNKSRHRLKDPNATQDLPGCSLRRSVIRWSLPPPMRRPLEIPLVERVTVCQPRGISSMP